MSTASWLAISPAAAPPIPSHTAKSEPCLPTDPARLVSSRPRVLRVRSATRKLSSLCSRICPTSVRAKSLTRISPRASPASSESPGAGAAWGVSGCVTCGLSPSSYAGAGRVDVEAQELLADPEVIARMQSYFVPYSQERPVGGAEVGQRERLRLPGAAAHAHGSVPARQERIVGEHDVAGLPSDDGLGLAQVKDVAHEALDRALAQASVARCGRCSEEQRAVLGRGAKPLLRLFHNLEL